jgi:hypothetical protein
MTTDDTTTIGRFLLCRVELDGTERPLAPAGKPLAFHTASLAEAAAKGYPAVFVRDTRGAA